MKVARRILGLLALPTATLAAVGAAYDRPAGYLDHGDFDILAVLPPAPQKDDPRGKADRAVFRVTRKLAGTPRWALAVNDVKLSDRDMMADYSCAVGFAFTPETAPATAHLLDRALADTGQSSRIAKDFNRRLRPFQIDRGATCQPPEELKGSYDYPSGHTTLGWTWATLLAELLPDRATTILARGRAYGESRIVCGVHNMSAVEAGWTTASSTLAAVHAKPAFQLDLAAARIELAALRRTAMPLAADACDAEAALVRQSVYPGARGLTAR